MVQFALERGERAIEVFARMGCPLAVHKLWDRGAYRSHAAQTRTVPATAASVLLRPEKITSGSTAAEATADVHGTVERAFRLPCRYSYRHTVKNVGKDADVAA
jgi:hypothetical protein